MLAGNDGATFVSIALCLVQCAVAHPATILARRGPIHIRQIVSDSRNFTGPTKLPGDGTLGESSIGSLAPAATSNPTNETVDQAIKDAQDDPIYSTSISPSLSAALEAEWADYFSISPSESSVLEAEYAKETSIFGDASFYPTSLSPHESSVLEAEYAAETSIFGDASFNPTSLSPHESSVLEAEFEAETSLWGEFDDPLTDYPSSYSEEISLGTAIPASESSELAAELAALSSGWPDITAVSGYTYEIATPSPSSLLGGGYQDGLLGTFSVRPGGGGLPAQLAGVSGQLGVPVVTPITPVTPPSSIVEPTGGSTPPEIPPTTPAIPASITPPPIAQPSGRRRRL